GAQALDAAPEDARRKRAHVGPFVDRVEGEDREPAHARHAVACSVANEGDRRAATSPAANPRANAERRATRCGRWARLDATGDAAVAQRPARPARTRAMPSGAAATLRANAAPVPYQYFSMPARCSLHG